jgi:hypothetical protein
MRVGVAEGLPHCVIGVHCRVEAFAHTCYSFGTGSIKISHVCMCACLRACVPACLRACVPASLRPCVSACHVSS